MYDVRFVSVNDNINISKNSSSLDDISVPLKILMNDLYAKDISNKVKSTLKIKQENGKFIGSFAPFGYLKDPNDKHKFIIDEEATYIVKKIFNMTLLGKSKREIVEELNRKEVLTPELYKISKSLLNSKNTHAVKKWNSEMISRILDNQSYTGDLIQGVKKKLNYKSNKLANVNKSDWIIIQNHHEAIISKEEFEQVQVLKGKYVKINKNNEIDLFSGLLRCSDCNSTFTIRKSNNQTYYYCSNYVRNKKCTKQGINKKKLEDKVLNEINKRYNDILVLDRKMLNKLVDIIYISDNKEIKVKFKIQ